MANATPLKNLKNMQTKKYLIYLFTPSSIAALVASKLKETKSRPQSSTTNIIDSNIREDEMASLTRRVAEQHQMIISMKREISTMNKIEQN